MALSTRERRNRRIRRALPIVEELEEYTREVYADDLFTTEEGWDASPMWLATPFSHTRDSELLEECNWEVLSEELSEKFPNTVQEMRFGHWGYGWYERIYVRRDDALALKAVQDFVNALSGYPILDEERYDKARSEKYNEWLSSQLGGYPGENDDDYRDKVREYLRETYDVIYTDEDDVTQDMIKDAIRTVPHPYDRWQWGHEDGEEECYYCNQPRSAACHNEAPQQP